MNRSVFGVPRDFRTAGKKVMNVNKRIAFNSAERLDLIPEVAYVSLCRSGCNIEIMLADIARCAPHNRHGILNNLVMIKVKRDGVSHSVALNIEAVILQVLGADECVVPVVERRNRKVIYIGNNIRICCFAENRTADRNSRNGG